MGNALRELIFSRTIAHVKHSVNTGVNDTLADSFFQAATPSGTLRRTKIVTTAIVRVSIGGII